MLDSINRYVSDLRSEHFKITEGKVEQRVGYSVYKSAPLSMAIVIHSTEYSYFRPEPVLQTITGLLKSENPDDEIAPISMGSQTALVEKFNGQTPIVAGSDHPIGKISGMDRIDEAIYLGAAISRGAPKAGSRAAVKGYNAAAVETQTSRST